MAAVQHRRRICPHCGHALRQEHLQKAASKIKETLPNERVFVYICPGTDSRKPHPPKILEFIELVVDEKQLKTIIKSIGLPEERFDEAIRQWQEWAKQRFKPKTWIGEENQTIHISAKKVK